MRSWDEKYGRWSPLTHRPFPRGPSFQWYPRITHRGTSGVETITYLSQKPGANVGNPPRADFQLRYPPAGLTTKSTERSHRVQSIVAREAIGRWKLDAPSCLRFDLRERPFYPLPLPLGGRL